MAIIDKVKVRSTTYDIRDANSVKYDDVLQPTNPFGGKKLYINSIDNAFHSADNRFYVTATVHSVSYNSKTYPYIDSSKSATEDDYIVDSPVEQTITSESLFDGSYEDGIQVVAGKYMRLRVMFEENKTPATATVTQQGYPYGSFYLSYYYVCKPAQHSLYRVYNKFKSHGLGWKVYTASDYIGALNDGGSSYIESISDEVNYYRTCMDFIIFGSSDNTYGRTITTEIEWRKSRPDLSYDGSTVTKYGSNTLYNPLYFSNNHTNTITINPNGSITASTFVGSLSGNSTTSTTSTKSDQIKDTTTSTYKSAASKLLTITNSDGTTTSYNVLTV